MNTRQLAYILIKVLGLSIVAHSIPAGINTALTLVIAQGMGAQHGDWFPHWFPFVSTVASFAIGIALIVGSRGLAAALFKDESPG